MVTVCRKYDKVCQLYSMVILLACLSFILDSLGWGVKNSLLVVKVPLWTNLVSESIVTGKTCVFIVSKVHESIYVHCCNVLLLPMVNRDLIVI